MKKSVSIALVMLAMAVFGSSVMMTTTSAQGDKGGAGGGAELYAKTCAKCHGADGKGVKSLDPPDFTTAAWQSKHTDAQITTAINNGKGVMPPYKASLKPAQVALLVKHIRTFAPKKK